MIGSGKFSQPLRVFLLCALGAFAVVSCGGGTPSGSNPATGSVSVVVTDLPTEDYCEINVTITDVILIGEDGQVTLYSDATGKTLNLLDLAHHSEVFSHTTGVPAGTYSKIRLQLAGGVQLKPATSDGGCAPESEWIEARVPSSKLDLNPQGDFTVAPDGVMVVELDMDAKAFKLTGTGSGQYIVRPVVFVDVMTNDDTGKLVRVFGTVANKTATDSGGHFELCRTDIALKDDDDDDYDERCVLVNTSAQTSFFNELGDPATFDDVMNDDPATVIGRLAVTEMHDLDDDDRGEADREYDERVILNAEVVELGEKTTYGRYTGIVKTLPVDDRFDFDFDPPQGFEEGTVVPVQLQTGTKLFARDGTALSIADFEVEQRAKVEGVFVVGDSDFIKSSVVWLDIDIDKMVYQGSVDTTTIDLAARTFTLVPTTDPASVVTDRIVEVTADAVIVLVNEHEGALMNDRISLSEMKDLDGIYDAEVRGYERVDGVIVSDRIILSMAGSSP